MGFFKKYRVYLALVVIIAMMIIYGSKSCRIIIYNIVDVFIRPFIDLNIPFLVILLILSTITAFYSAIIYKHKMNFDKMREIQEKSKTFNQKYREAVKSQDRKAMEKMQAQQMVMMRYQMSMMKDNFIPMAYVIIITSPILIWIYEYTTTISNTVILPFSGSMPYTEICLGVFQFWILWYMICSITVGQIIRKMLNIGVIQ